MHDLARRALVVCSVLASLSAALPQATAAQMRPATVTARLDATVLTRDRWRGIRRNAHPVGHIDGLVGVRLGDVSISVGAWASAEPGSTRGEILPDLRAGGRGISQWSLWTQLAFHRGPLIVAGGVLRDEYVRLTGDPAVSELFASARLQAGRWSPSVALWQAVDGASGAYLEPAIGYHHFVNPFTGPAVSWTTTLRGGVQLAERRPVGEAVPGPEETGLTHLALGTGLRFAFNVGWKVALVAAAGVEAQLNVDPATKQHRNGSDAGDFRLWAPVQLGVSVPLRRPE